MNKLILLPIMLLILSSSCKKEQDIVTETGGATSKNLKIKLFKEGVIKEIYTYDKENHLLSDTFYLNGVIDFSEKYEYSDDFKIKYLLRYYGNSIGADTIKYGYIDNNISTINENGALYNVQYKQNNTLDKIEVIAGMCGCMYEFEFLLENVSSVNYKIPTGYHVDSLQYDNKVNPFRNFWPTSIYNAKYISPNNITYHKYVSVENLNWNNGGPPNYHTWEVIKKYDYEYNSDGLPVRMIEYNLSSHDTTEYHFEYIEL